MGGKRPSKPARMILAEARKRKPKYKEYKRIRDAENFARSLGVKDVVYGRHLRIGNVANHALLLVYERRLPLPSRIEIKDQFTRAESEDPNDFGYYLTLPGSNTPGELYFNAARKVWTNIAEAMKEGRERNIFSTDDARHLVMHELGEVAMHQSVGADRYDSLHEAYLQDEKEFQEQVDKDHVKQVVSDYAVENHSEFVAEMFAALLLGRDDLRKDEVLMKAFQRFAGDQLVEWLS